MQNECAIGLVSIASTIMHYARNKELIIFHSGHHVGDTFSETGAHSRCTTLIYSNDPISGLDDHEWRCLRHIPENH